MDTVRFCFSGYTPALDYALGALTQRGFYVSDSPSAQITHLILPAPSFEPDGRIKGGDYPKKVLAQLPQDVTVIGGLLDRPDLETYRRIDLLKDPFYTAQNAAITAHCAVKLAMSKLSVTLENQPVLVIGWGRIGKCLAKLCAALGARVSIAARKESDRAILSALGYRVTDTQNIDTIPYRVIFNTVPQMICPVCPGNALKIDLASRPGLGGDDIIWARGLPGKDAPESSGVLIAETILRLI